MDSSGPMLSQSQLLWIRGPRCSNSMDNYSSRCCRCAVRVCDLLVLRGEMDHDRPCSFQFVGWLHPDLNLTWWCLIQDGKTLPSSKFMQGTKLPWFEEIDETGGKTASLMAGWAKPRPRVIVLTKADLVPPHALEVGRHFHSLFLQLHLVKICMKHPRWTIYCTSIF